MPFKKNKIPLKSIFKPKAGGLVVKLTPKQVLAYLQANPKFLSTHATALAKGQVKAPKTVGNIFSLHAAQAGTAENKLNALKKRQSQIIAMARANAEATAQAHAAVLTILNAPSAAALGKALQGPFKTALGLQAARLLRAGKIASATSLTLPGLQQLCPKIIVLEQFNPETHGTLFGPQGKTLKSCALLRLEKGGQTVGLLALGSETAQHFYAGQGTDLLEFLRQVVSLQVKLS